MRTEYKYYQLELNPLRGSDLHFSINHGFTPAVINIKSFQDFSGQNHECGLI